MKKMSLMLGKVSDALHEMQTTKTREYAEHPKVNVVTLNPTATSPQEVCYVLSTLGCCMWLLIIMCTEVNFDYVLKT